MKPENITEALENFIRALNGIQFFTQKFTKKIHMSTADIITIFYAVCVDI